MNSSADKRGTTSIVLVTYNSQDVIVQCLSALLPRSSEIFEVIVVDNASHDATVELIREDFPWVNLVVMHANVGFALGVQRAIEEASGDIYCLLNPDAVATSNAIALLSTQLRISPDIGVLAPLILQPQGRLKVVSAGHLPTCWRMFTHYSGLSRLGKISKRLEGHYLLPNQLQEAQDVEWVTGACLFIRSSVYHEAGGISVKWFMYAEDIELCWRVGKLGYRIRLDTSSTVTHLLGSSTGTQTPIVRSDWILNLFDFYISDLAARKSTGRLWRWIVCAGLFSRGVIFHIWGAQRRSPEWKNEAKKFFSYANSVARIPSASRRRQ